MKLLSITYQNNEQEWRYDKINFFDLTLLVGVSGAGKTQILHSIYDIKKIANGKSLNGVKWSIKFQILNGKKYHWKGEFENLNSKNDLIDSFDSEEQKERPRVINEELIDEKDNLIIKRNIDSFSFNNIKMPKLNSYESALSILNEEKIIKDISDSFKLIILRDHTQKEGVRFSRLSIEKLKKKFDNFTKIKESELDTFHKLALIYEISSPTFNEIKEKFIDVFPQIQDLKIEPVRENEFSNIIFEATVIQLKEQNVQEWIPHNRMSSGMLRTLLHIAEMYLWNEGTVILIDEFENSLGVNCIDVLTEDLLYTNNSIQFIATSHHPYIINKIPYENWKIVKRKGSKITTVDAKEFNLGRSHHDQFMSLINHPQYINGLI